MTEFHRNRNLAGVGQTEFSCPGNLTSRPFRANAAIHSAGLARTVDTMTTQLLRHFLLTCFALLFTGAAVYADSTVTTERTTTTLGEGIYEIRHPDAPDTFPQGN